MGIVVLARLWGGVCDGGQTDEWQRADDNLAHGWSSGVAKPVWFVGKWCCAVARTGAAKALARNVSPRLLAWKQTVGRISVVCRGRS